jgi:penicillin-binding protein 2
MVGKRSFPCHGGAVHGDIDLPHAIAVSCNVFFMTEGLATGPQKIADEALRFHFGQPTGIELLYEKRGIVPPPEWKERTQGQKWFPGDTANTSIGQGFVLVTPLQMACFAASLARGETYTPATLIHKADRPRLRTESIGIAPQQYNTIMDGMKLCIESGTGRRLTQVLKLGSLKIAGKTGTAQKAVYENNAFKGNINYAWFMGFAPYDDPQIAVVVMLEGNVPGEEYGGGAMSAPVAGAVFKKYFEKKYEKPALPAIATTTAAK